MLEPHQPRHRPESAYAKFVKYFTLVMSLIYPALGLYILFSTPQQIRLDPTVKILLGIVLVVYGVVRFVRAYQQHFKKRTRLRDEE